MERLYSKYRERVEFFVVYIQEAHPTDGWQVDSNVQDEVYYRQHQSYDEREEVAQSCTIGLHISIPTLVEEMDNAAVRASAPRRSTMADASWCRSVTARRPSTSPATSKFQ